MRYVISAPPGGLGHFLSRIIAKEYNYDVSARGSYHGLKKTYASQTAQKELADKIIREVDEEVVCLHNFTQQNLTTIFPNRTVVNIVIDSEWAIYLNNFYRKAIQSSKTVDKKYIDNVNQKFPTSKNALREEFFFLYQALVSGNIEWLDRRPLGICISFGNLYNFDNFLLEIKKIPNVDLTNIDKIWDHFYTAQQPIIQRVSKYQTICDDIVNNSKPIIPKDFDNVDYGIMCGMIQHQHNQDFLNLDNNNWYE
jgi:hypothetical protein